MLSRNRRELHGLGHLDGVDPAAVRTETVFAIDRPDLADGDENPALSAYLAMAGEHGFPASHGRIVGDTANTSA
jgi:hypothetical protein